jgi:hypothetical protein
MKLDQQYYKIQFQKTFAQLKSIASIHESELTALHSQLASREEEEKEKRRKMMEEFNREVQVKDEIIRRLEKHGDRLRRELIMAKVVIKNPFLLKKLRDKENRKLDVYEYSKSKLSNKSVQGEREEKRSRVVDFNFGRFLGHRNSTGPITWRNQESSIKQILENRRNHRELIFQRRNHSVIEPTPSKLNTSD